MAEKSKAVPIRTSVKGGPTRRLEMPDLFGGAEKKTRPASATILSDQGSLYSLLRDFSHWSRFTRYVKHVEQLSPTEYRWTVEHKGKQSQFETEVIDDRPGEMIAWRTKAGAPIRQTSALLLEPAPADRGTIVSLKIVNDGPLGKLLGIASKLLLSDPDSEAADTVRRFKAYVETGEVPTVEGQPSGRAEDLAEEKVA